jgi:hypothetical protein
MPSTAAAMPPSAPGSVIALPGEPSKPCASSH